MIHRISLLIAALLVVVCADAQQPAPAPPQTSASALELIPIIVADGKHHGEVDLTVDIDSSGTVSQAVSPSGDPQLVKLASQAVRTFRYTTQAGTTGAHEHVSFLTGKQMHSVAPVYPPIARAAHVHGAVVLAAAVEPDGHVGNIVVLSGPPMLQGAATDSLKQWTFPPANAAGSPVAARALVTINFAFSGGL